MRDGSPRHPTVALGLVALLALSCATGTREHQMRSDAADSAHAAWSGAGEWLLARRIPGASGAVWAADPDKPDTVGNGLYSGSAGVVLFLLEGWRANHDERWLEAGRAGADHLAAAVETEVDPGLYTGLTGMAFVLEHAARTTGEARYDDAARRAIERVIAAAHPIGSGVDWGPAKEDPDDPPSNDVVSGSAGIGLGLLWAHRAFAMPQALETATLAGRRLIEVAIPAAPQGIGLRWQLAPGLDRTYPNFAHGTAGVAYFLASLYQDTHFPAALAAARSGARYLQAIATPTGNGCLIFRHEPDAKDLYYYSWCHGPAGTARLFYRLYRITGERGWMDFVERLGRGVLASDIPEVRQPGFWNVSQCCGSAGVAEFALTLHELTGRPEYRALADRMTRDLVARATRDGSSWRWVQAENRTEPNAVAAQTGLMQGAAGIGLWFLRLERFREGSPLRLSLPDSPF